MTKTRKTFLGKATNMATSTYILPADWASYLMDQDASSFALDAGGDAATTDVIDAWLDRENLTNCLNCSDQPFFTWHPDFPDIGDTCLNFTFAVRSQMLETTC